MRPAPKTKLSSLSLLLALVALLLVLSCGNPEPSVTSALDTLKQAIQSGNEDKVTAAVESLIDADNSVSADVERRIYRVQGALAQGLLGPQAMAALSLWQTNAQYADMRVSLGMGIMLWLASAGPDRQETGEELIPLIDAMSQAHQDLLKLLPEAEALLAGKTVGPYLVATVTGMQQGQAQGTITVSVQVLNAGDQTAQGVQVFFDLDDLQATSPGGQSLGAIPAAGVKTISWQTAFRADVKRGTFGIRVEASNALPDYLVDLVDLGSLTSLAAAKGSLTVNISGLSDQSQARVTVSGPGGYYRTLDHSQLLDNLLPGDYIITAQDVPAGVVTYSPTVTGSPAAVASSSTATARVNYTLPPRFKPRTPIIEAPPPPPPVPSFASGQSLIQDPSWACLGDQVVAEGGKLVVRAQDAWAGLVNPYGPHLEVLGDFAVSAIVENTTGGNAGLSLYGALGGWTGYQEWWRGSKRLEVYIGGSAVNVWWWTGDSEKSEYRSFPVKGLGKKVSLEVRRVGGDIIVLANNAVAGSVKDPGLFNSGQVYIGFSVAPKNTLIVYDVSAKSLTSKESDVQVLLGPGSATFVPGPSSLRSLAAPKGLRIGPAVQDKPLAGDPLYAQTLVREFNSLTVENMMKWQWVHPERGRYNFCQADFIVDFALANEMQVRGHPLVWNRSLPDWLIKGNFGRDELTSILRDHIFSVVGHYRGKVSAWDVVVAAIDRTTGKLRDDIWMLGIGPDYVDMAFRWAREADPQARLFYTDSFHTPGTTDASDAVYELVRGMIERGVPIDGVGMNAHLSVAEPADLKWLQAEVQRLADLGLEVQITTLDVQLDTEQITPDLLDKQAKLYGDALDVCLSAPNCTTFVTWGYTDRYPRAGTPLIFDPDYNPRPAYYALSDILSKQ